MNDKSSLTSPIDAELDALRARVSRRREYLELLEVELANTRTVIQEFTDLYNARISPLETRYRQLREMLDQLTADQAPPDTEWKTRHNGQKQKSGQNGHKRGEDRLPKQKSSAIDKDPDYERKIRDLFRRLAKQHHPDLAQQVEDKKRREDLMAEINQAYSAKDLDALEKLATRNGTDRHAGWVGADAEIARLALELRQLDAMIFEVEQTIRELDLSHAMQMRSEMKADRETGRDYLSEIEADYRARILELQEQLIAMGQDLDQGVSQN